MDREKDGREPTWTTPGNSSYEWGMSDEACTLAQYLGLNEQEEDAWVSESEEALLALLDAQKS